jgi:hypothetical protein
MALSVEFPLGTHRRPCIKPSMRELLNARAGRLLHLVIRPEHPHENSLRVHTNL